ncbi:fluoride efflux transporter FluC [Alteribacillus bidgolensis]|uniref:Fluoride-specific ion channel FluC n=1 Tax=Alteribacillus bidgolensis TaxID=930129 RepID=A0A1G8IBV9_9BACI|nr:CrcB family protein [Alteribacillus bidgolensis]SDI16373.1 camphor resistance protein CrcB [Alteribacillus bidgolensis]
MKNIIAIGIGAAIGTYLRYFLNLQTLFVGYPIGTLIENLAGSLLLGLLSGYFAAIIPKDWVKAGLGVGFCGGFTTFSTFASDTVWLFLDQNLWQSLLYVITTITGGVLLAFLGFALGQKTGNKKVLEKRMGEQQ